MRRSLPVAVGLASHPAFGLDYGQIGVGSAPGLAKCASVVQVMGHAPDLRLLAEITGILVLSHAVSRLGEG